MSPLEVEEFTEPQPPEMKCSPPLHFIPRYGGGSSNGLFWESSAQNLHPWSNLLAEQNMPHSSRKAQSRTFLTRARHIVISAKGARESWGGTELLRLNWRRKSSIQLGLSRAKPGDICFACWYYIGSDGASVSRCCKGSFGGCWCLPVANILFEVEPM